jgi:hypothetical protein
MPEEVGEHFADMDVLLAELDELRATKAPKTTFTDTEMGRLRDN